MIRAAVPAAAGAAARPRPATWPGWLTRWGAPAVQAAALVLVLAIAGTQVAAARADLAAELGSGPVVPVPRVVAAVAPPVALAIPDLKLTTRLIGLRRARNGTLQVPQDPARAGWYSQGPAPGDEGPAVIVGHVDSFRGPGIFAAIDTLAPGARIAIRRSDGSRATFAVTQVQRYSKRSFPTAVVYRGNGGASLRLITCGGEFDRRTGHYRDNVVVFAAAV